jgi:integrase/recombinase XerD
MTLSQGIKQYIALRQAYGLDFSGAIPVLHQFADYCKDKHLRRISVVAVLDWVQTYPNATSLSNARRIRIVRGFASYWKAFDQDTEIPPRELSQKYGKRSTPYIFAKTEIGRMMTECLGLGAERGQSNPIRPQTFYAAFGLIASTGLRRSEAINLKREHLDLDKGMMLIEMTKFRKSRLIPLHPTTVMKLKEYAAHRDRVICSPQTDHFFLMNRGQPLDENSITYAFLQICETAKLRPIASRTGFPRIHDLRHTFATHVILKWLKAGKDVHALMPALSTYMGHSRPADTYWYLTGVPELMRFGLHEIHR